jgi:hypothetical protein
MSTSAYIVHHTDTTHEREVTQVYTTSYSNAIVYGLRPGALFLSGNCLCQDTQYHLWTGHYKLGYLLMTW